ncbi:DUF7882 family protein [Frigoribacterium salinisoli]
MGYFIYDGGTAEVQMEDRVLAHLQIVIISKLRRQESFAFSWKDPASSGDGRSTVWLHPTVSLRFKFSGSRPPSINTSWVAALTTSANSGSGLHVLPEPTDGEPADHPGRAHASAPGASDPGSLDLPGGGGHRR